MSSRCRLLELPAELINLIASALSSSSSEINSLCRAHSALHKLLTPVLYHHDDPQLRVLPLAFGAIVGSTSTINKALDHGANVNLTANWRVLDTLNSVLSHYKRPAPGHPPGPRTGSDVKRVGRSTPLVYAIKYKQYDAARVLVSRGADVNLQCMYTHQTPLQTACDPDLIPFLELLFEHGCEPPAWTGDSSRSNHPLRLAIKYENANLARLLLNCGADISVLKTRALWLLRELVRKTQAFFEEIVDLLNVHGARIHEWEACDHSGDYSLLSLCVVRAQIDKVRFLVARGLAQIKSPPPLDRPVGSARALLHHAADRGDVEMIEYLLENGASPVIRVVDDLHTPLLRAAREGRSAAARALLVGTDNMGINMTDKDGFTALHLACMGDSTTELVRVLLEHGIDVNCISGKETAALYYLVCKSEEEHRKLCASVYARSLKLLLDHGAEAGEVDCEAERSALSFAVEAKCSRCVGLLLSAVGRDGAETDRRDVLGQTAWHYAWHAGWYDEFCEVVEEQGRVERAIEAADWWAAQKGYLASRQRR